MVGQFGGDRRPMRSGWQACVLVIDSHSSRVDLEGDLWGVFSFFFGWFVSRWVDRRAVFSDLTGFGMASAPVGGDFSARHVRGDQLDLVKSGVHGGRFAFEHRGGVLALQFGRDRLFQAVPRAFPFVVYGGRVAVARPPYLSKFSAELLSRLAKRSGALNQKRAELVLVVPAKGFETESLVLRDFELLAPRRDGSRFRELVLVARAQGVAHLNVD